MKLYPICEPWYGDEGPGFERGFKEDFPANISKKVKDAFSNGNAREVQHGLIYVYLIRTYEMIADCLTKVPPKDLFARFMTIFYGTSHGYKSARQTF